MSENSKIEPGYLKYQNSGSSCCRMHPSEQGQNNYSDDDYDVPRMLGELPKIKARPGFAQKMSALFALELERETLQRNKSWIQRKKGVKLPSLRSDISKELL